MNIPACTWAYCTSENRNEMMKCTQICLEGITATANRNLKFKAWIPLTTGQKFFKKAFDVFAQGIKPWEPVQKAGTSVCLWRGMTM